MYAGLSKGWVYPRVCGGTPVYGTESRLAYGLSPRMRGNPQHISLPLV